MAALLSAEFNTLYRGWLADGWPAAACLPAGAVRIGLVLVGFLEDFSLATINDLTLALAARGKSQSLLIL